MYNCHISQIFIRTNRYVVHKINISVGTSIAASHALARQHVPVARSNWSPVTKLVGADC